MDKVEQLEHDLNMMANHVNAMTNRVIHAEMALDVFLGIMFEDEELKDEFAEKYKKRMEEVKEAREMAVEKAREEAGVQEDEDPIIITP